MTLLPHSQKITTLPLFQWEMEAIRYIPKVVIRLINQLSISLPSVLIKSKKCLVAYLKPAPSFVLWISFPQHFHAVIALLILTHHQLLPLYWIIFISISFLYKQTSESLNFNIPWYYDHQDSSKVSCPFSHYIKTYLKNGLQSPSPFLNSQFSSTTGPR